MPESLSFTEAAAAPSSLITAWESLFDKGGLKEGQAVLIHTGAGGVGHIAVQLAAVKGARVCATVVNEKQRETAEGLGAHKVIDVSASDFVKETLEWTRGLGVDAAIDLVGGETFFRTFACVACYGTVVALLGPDPKYENWAEARLRKLKIWFALMLTPMYYDLVEMEEHHTKILGECSRLFDSGKLRVLINRTFPLEKACDAHRALEEGHTIGKIVLLVD